MNVYQEERLLASHLRDFLRDRSPIARAINLIRANTSQCFLFGGALRDIVRPEPHARSIRDVDLVVSRSDLKRLVRECGDHIDGINRFGGLQLNICSVPLDVWALEETWAFRNNHVVPHSFYYLTRTTFLNIDGIVADISANGPSGVKVFARDFLYAFHHRLLDITLNENPFPTLVAIKALRAMYRYDLPVSRALASYLLNTLKTNMLSALEEEQLRHYHRVIFDRTHLGRLRCDLEEYLSHSRNSNEAFSPSRQLALQGW